MKHTHMILLSALVLGSLLATTTAEAADGGSYNSGGAVGFVPNDGSEVVLPVDPDQPDGETPVDPFDPTTPDGKPNPGTKGPLSIDYASSLQFSQNQISNLDTTYYADAQAFTGALAGQFRGNYVQVTDNRGSLAGWTLSVKQGGQFNSDSAQKFKTLTGAAISFTSPVADSSSINEVEAPIVGGFTLDPEGASSVVMTAQAGQGVGTWVNQFGGAEATSVEGKDVQKNKAVSLFVPGATPKEAKEYRTTLVWTLADTPSPV